MIIPAPVAGLVIRYGYLWHSEYLEGREEGQRDRPCSIVAAIRTGDSGGIRVLVLPVTHSAPGASDIAIEIPARIKQHLRLDAERSWIILSEWNEFAWPGPDLRPVPGADSASSSYGFLPPGFFNIVRECFLALTAGGKARQVPRTE